MAENTNVVELVRNSESDHSVRIGMDLDNLKVNTNYAAKSKVGVTIMKKEIDEESNSSPLELDGRNIAVNNIKVNENMEVERNKNEPDLVAVRNEENSELKLENEISDTNTTGHVMLDANSLQGTSNNNREFDQRQHTISKSDNEIHLIQVNNQSLQLLHAYDDNDEEDDDNDDESTDEGDDDEEEVIYDGEYRETHEVLTESEQDSDSDSSSSSSSSSTSLFFSNTTDSDSGNELGKEAVNNKLITKKNAHQPVKTKGELTLEDLPPIEDLKISVSESECVAVGKVYQIVDKLVVIEALKNTPVLDLDSVLFFEGGQPLGHIYDVFGPVTEPYYCVRFNSNEHIKEKNIVKDQIVYCAPKTEYTSYVFVNALMKMKGSDASWKHNNEPPPNQLDYSDDEEERRAKKALRKPPVRIDVDDANVPPRKRPTAYEQRMNERNLQMNMRAANRQRTLWKERSSRPVQRVSSTDIVWSPAMPQSVFEQPAPVIPTSFSPRPPNPAFGTRPFFAPVIQNNIPRQQPPLPPPPAPPPPPSSSQFFLGRHPFMTVPPFSPPPQQRNNIFFDHHSCMTLPPPQYRY